MIFFLEELVLPADTNIRILSRHVDGNQLFFTLKAGSNQAVCPSCSRTSSRVHSQYTRRIDDLPAGDFSVHIQLVTKKWFCDHADCPAKVFTERLDWVRSYGRKTERLEEVIRKIGFSTNCLIAEKVCCSLGIPVSHDTILRRVKHTDNHSVQACPFRRHR